MKIQTTAFFQPVFMNKPFYSSPPSLTITPASKSDSMFYKLLGLFVGLSASNKQMDRTPRDETAPWRDLHLMAIVVIEIQYPGHLHIGHLR